MLNSNDGSDRFAADAIGPLVNFVSLCGQKTADSKTTTERRVLATKTHKSHKSKNRGNERSHATRLATDVFSAWVAGEARAGPSVVKSAIGFFPPRTPRKLQEWNPATATNGPSVAAQPA